MSISIKTAREIEKMRRAGELLEKVHDELGRAIHPGMSTWEINKLGEEMIRSFGCTPNFLNYNGYPASICVSVNEEVVHGIPSKKRILKEGDIVSRMRDLSMKDTIPTQPAHTRSVRSRRRQENWWK